MDKADSGVHADEQQHDAKRDAGVTGQTLRAFANRDAPVNEEEPDTVRKMPYRCGDADHVEDKDRDHAKLARDDIKSLVRIIGHGQVVQAGNHPKPEVEHVKKDEEEENDAGDALDQVEPVARVRIVQVVGPRFDGDHEPVDGVIDERYKDAADLDKQDVRNRLQVDDRAIEILRAGQRLRVGIKVF